MAGINYRGLEHYGEDSDGNLSEKQSCTDKVKEGIVLQDFVAEQKDDLEVTEGSRIQIVKQLDDEWYFARSGDNVGIIPISFVKILDS